MVTVKIFSLVLLGILIWGILIFNSLVRSRNRADNAWAQIDVQLKRRHDLIPNLVKVVKRYFEHERDVLESVTRARSEAMMAAENLPMLAKAEDALSGTLRSLFSLIESYPDLKAHKGVRDLMEELTTTENRLAFARQHYNDSALILNNAIESFPKSIVASAFRFTKKDFFK